MIRRPPSSTRTDTLFPYTTLFRSLGVFDELLRYHAEWYNRPENDKRAKRDGCVRNEDNLWQLSLAQRRAILQNNIYGVDIDRQAVEVAQLSLFLKLLEDERATSARQYQLDYARPPHPKTHGRAAGRERVRQYV